MRAGTRLEGCRTRPGLAAEFARGGELDQRMAVLSLASGHWPAALRQEEKIWHDQSVRVAEVLTGCLV